MEADALAFLRVDTRQYDLICVDVFQDADVPAHLLSEEFLLLLQRRLAPAAALIYNRLADTTAHQREAVDYYERHFKPLFPNGTVANTGGNHMLINDARFVD